MMKKWMLICAVFTMALSGCSSVFHADTGFGLNRLSTHGGIVTHGGVSHDGVHAGVGVGVEATKEDSGRYHLRNRTERFFDRSKEPLLLGEPLPPMFKAEEINNGMMIGTILTWTEDSPTGKLLGERNWHIGNDDSFQRTKYLYAAVSIEELAVVKDKLYGDRPVGWPWIQACEERLIVSVWYDKSQRPFYALRLDHFDKFKDKIRAVHKGRLPWWVTRTEDDDPKEV